MRRVIALALSTTMSWPLSAVAVAEAVAAPESVVRPAAPAPPPTEPPLRPAPRVDPELARANADMLAVYRATSTAVTGDAQTALFESQRLWTRYAEQRCQLAQEEISRSPRDARRETLSQCLTHAAAIRQAELKGALMSVGPWTFLRVTDHRIRPRHAGRGAGGVEDSITRIQLARADTDSARRWNVAVTRQLEQVVNIAYDLAAAPPPERGRDIAVNASADVAAVNGDLINVTLHATADPAGPPPPQTSARSLIWSMRLGRPIEDADLFDPRSPWRPSLAQMAADRLDPSAPTGATLPEVQAVSPLAADPARWTLKPTGLMLDLRANASSQSQRVALVPWPLLSPYLKRPLFVDPASLTEPPKG